MRIGHIAAITIALLGSAGCARIAPPVAAASAQAPSVGARGAVRGERRGQPEAQPAVGRCRAATCATPTGSATISATLIMPPSGAAARAGTGGAGADRPRGAERRPSGFPTTCSNGSATLDLRGLQPDMLALTAVRPLDHFNGFHTGFAEISAGDSIAPFKTVKDYDNGLQPDRRFRGGHGPRRSCGCAKGMASDVVQPRLVMDNVVEQLDAMLAEGVEGSSFMKPLERISRRHSRGRARAADGGLYAGRSRPKLRPALTAAARLHRQRISAADARDRSALATCPAGDKLYRLSGRVEHDDRR